MFVELFSGIKRHTTHITPITAYGLRRHYTLLSSICYLEVFRVYDITVFFSKSQSHNVRLENCYYLLLFDVVNILFSYESITDRK
jgi:hypothetical protein